MPSIITSSSEDSESEAFTVESQSDENDYEKIVVSDSDDVFLSGDDEIQKKDKSMEMGVD